MAFNVLSSPDRTQFPRRMASTVTVRPSRTKPPVAFKKLCPESDQPRLK